MSEELSALIRASAEHDAAAAARETPFTTETIGRYVRDARRRRTAGAVTLGVSGVVVVGAALLGVVRPWSPEPPVTDERPLPSVVATTPVPTPSPSPTLPTAPPAVPVAPPPTSDPTTPPTSSPHHSSDPQTPTPPPVLHAPPAATIEYAGPGGGSGEAMITWLAVEGATGYRVYRSGAAAGPFVPAARFDVATGTSTTEYVGPHEYVGISPYSPGGFTYVEAVSGTPAYLMVVAYNDGGDGPGSAAVCAAAQASTLVCPS